MNDAKTAKRKPDRDESMFMVMAAKQLEAFTVAYQIGQYVAEQRVLLNRKDLTDEQRTWLESHIKRHDDWAAACIETFTAERDRRAANGRRLTAEYLDLGQGEKL